MRVLLFIALFVWNTAIRAQTAKLTDMGTYWMFKSYVSIAMPDGNFLYQYPSYMFPLPKTLKWYTEIPGKLMFILDKKQTIFVEIINTLNSAVFFLVRKFYMLRCLFGTLYVDMRCFGVSWFFSKHKIPHPNQWGILKPQRNTVYSRKTSE